MGQRISPQHWLNGLLSATAAAALLCLAGGLAVPASAATLNERLAAKTQAKPGAEPDKLLVQAKEMVYNRDKNVVTAQGEVRLYYQGRTLQADKVTYDRGTNRVFATGNAKMTEADGTVSYGDRFDLTDDFKDGFIDSLKADTASKTHFTAARAERSDGENTVFDKGTYTACDACKDDPTKPPLWQVRAKRIIHKGEEHKIYYEDATVELYGFPVIYMPYFSAADSTVSRESGLLAPHYIYKTTLGYGVVLPYFWNLAPNYDLTLTPTILSRQGLLGDVEWRHRLINGSYSIKVAGIFQQDSAAFSAAPFGPGTREFRGSVDSTGLFYINEKWKFGWTVSASTDKFFTTDYKEPSASLTSNYFTETISTAYLNGQGERGYFDLRGYYIQGRSARDIQKQQPVVFPVVDYNKSFDLNPARSFGLGGQIDVDFNSITLSRQLAAYQATGTRTLDNIYGLYDVCNSYTPGKTTGNCLLRGIGGDYSRATLNLSWKRKFIDPIGEVWTPFAFARLNGSWLNLNTSNSLNVTSGTGTPILANSAQTNFFNGTTPSFNGEALPGAGLEYRYPFVAQTGWITHVFEPIGQIIVRPSNNNTTNKPLVNEDSQSLVFDDTNLFDWTKYSGYDRFEGGTRANLGAQYMASFTNGGYANVMAGQSFQLAGHNSYATADAANVGISSGLDTRKSDYVGRVAFSPNGNLSFITKGRFDEGNFTLRRLDASMTASLFGISTTLNYARYAAQPALGYDMRREGISATARYKFLDHYFVDGAVNFDLSRHLYNSTSVSHTGLFALASVGMGAGYEDECTTFNVRVNSTYTDNGTVSTRTRTTSVLFELKLRTLGDTKVKTSLTPALVTDGL